MMIRNSFSVSWGHSLRTAIGDVVATLDTGGPLKLAHDTVRSLNLIEEERANVGRRLRQDSGALSYIKVSS